MSKGEVERITSLRRKFMKNTEITSFDELENFTNITVLNGDGNGGEFTGCTNLGSIKLPPNVKSINAQCF